MRACDSAPCALSPAVSESEVEALIACGLSRRVAEVALAQLGSLAVVGKAAPYELEAAGVPPKTAAKIAAAFAVGRRAVAPTCDRPMIGTADDVWRVLRPRAADLMVEVFWVILLDTRNRMIGAPIEIARGSLTTVEVSPKEIFRVALRAGAAGAVLAHNHPSGDPTPSPEDLALTRRIRDLSLLLGVPVIDHVVVTTHSYRSIAEFEG